MSPQAGFEASTGTAGAGRSPELRRFSEMAHTRAVYIQLLFSYETGRRHYREGRKNSHLPKKIRTAVRGEMGVPGREGRAGGGIRRGAGPGAGGGARDCGDHRRGDRPLSVHVSGTGADPVDLLPGDEI